ncbi:DUF4426 domain-containing protein [Gilvimarinus sp. F26214L]|uniref:DUF4426 domain-containing protein n=1 Tax=Gilvimarinus sp. DZF01 TaxID=3461371 RepID=UPI004045B550
MTCFSRLFRFRPGLIGMLLAAALPASAQDYPERGYSRFQDHTVYYSVFSSTSVTPDVARLHGITRGADQVLVNVALVSNDRAAGGEPAQVSGSATNLMQQRRELQFKAISEDPVVYYLAPLRVTNEEVIHFNLQVRPQNASRTYNVKFSKKLYVNE